MVVEPRRRALDARRCGAELRQRSDLLDRADLGVDDGHGLAVVTDLLVVEPFLAEAGELERDVGIGEEGLLPVLVRLGRHRFPEEILPGLGVLGGGELRLLVEARIVDGVLDPDGRD